MEFLRSAFTHKTVEESPANSLSDSNIESATCQTYARKEHNRWANNDSVKNAIIGFSDGLTVPFALTAGLTSFGSQHLVIIGGIAELIAGSISMGLGAYLAAATERTAYLVRERRELMDVQVDPVAQEEETYAVKVGYLLNELQSSVDLY